MDKIGKIEISDLDDSLDIPIDKEIKSEASGQQTAKDAQAVLLARNEGYHIPTPQEDQNLRIAFAMKNKILYGKAYDIVRIPLGLDLGDLNQVQKRISEVVICEIKSTKRNIEGFKKYFFSISTAELLSAQSLKAQYQFAFVNIQTKEVSVMDLQTIYTRTKAIYPSWSISFG